MDMLYQSLVQVVEQDSLSRAAAHLHLTQPTLSRQIQQLEAALGVRLFDRVGRRLALNEAGEMVYRHAKRILGLEQQLRDELERFSDPESGTIRIGAGVTPSIYLLPSALSRYRAAHPGVTFDIQTGSSKEVISLLREREVALGIITTVDPKADDLDATPLLSDRLLLVAAPRHPLLSRGPLGLSEVGAFPFVVMRPGSGLRKLVMELANTAGWEMKIAMETDSLESSSRLVQLNAGIAVLPQSCVKDDLEARRLCAVPLSVSLPARTILLVRRKHFALPACAQQFATLAPTLMNTARGTMDWPES